MTAWLVIADLATTWIVCGVYLTDASATRCEAAEACARERYGRAPYRGVRIERRRVEG